ncbi:MAG: MYXO-CTERM sorting domain-containing protein [Deltaproteobacteria bacterium]|nr:MYXO-CTERM sorting domain-containing protein [Deltaproteobacteria bacterium]
MKELLLGIALLSSAPAAACSCAIRVIENVFAFDGRTLFQNAELRVAGVTALELPLTHPDGTVELVPVITDSVSQRLLPAAPLSPGAHHFDGIDEGGRVVAFDVIEGEDLEAPPAPVVTAQQSTGGAVPFLDGCGNPWPTDRVVLTIDVEPDDDGVIVVNDRAFVDEPVGIRKLDITENRGGVVAYDVTVRDFSGNVSETTTAEVWSGCEGGCTSSSSLPTAAALLLLLLLLRRRRR